MWQDGPTTGWMVNVCQPVIIYAVISAIVTLSAPVVVVGMGLDLSKHVVTPNISQI